MDSRTSGRMWACPARLRKSPAFAFVVVATLALGIGANTAIFELLDAVRLRALPIAKPSQLAQLQIVGGNGGFGVTDDEFSYFTVPMWQQVKQHHGPFSGHLCILVRRCSGGRSQSVPRSEWAGSQRRFL